MSVRSKPRVGIVIERFDSPGGIQTCFIELVTGLNEIGIVPDVVWDEPQNWEALGNPRAEAGFGGGKLGISSCLLEALPFWLAGRLRGFSFRTARLELDRYDFLYSFELEIRMPPHVPNICCLSGPSHLRMPGDRVDWRQLYRLRELGKLMSQFTSPLVGLDPNAYYVTHSDWIADLFCHRFGYRPQVIWPPVRSRPLPHPPRCRSGLLFLSRLVEVKKAEAMLALAEAFPEQKITIAGAVTESDRAFVDSMRFRALDRGLNNLRFIANPSEGRVAELLASHLLFIFPAQWEHFGIVTVEAIQAGLLPLVHDSGGQREIVPHASLRFSNHEEMLHRVCQALTMSVTERTHLISNLQEHAQRSAPDRYRQEMLEPLLALKERC